MASSLMRGVKNITKGYSAVQIKVRDATSNDPWGPTGADMAEIARLTYNPPTDFYEVMDMLDKRLNDKGKNWRHVLKSLKVLDYCLHDGSDLCVTWARKNLHIIKTLQEFVYVDEEGKDVGANIRHAAKELTALIGDEARLRSERASGGKWQSRVAPIDDMNGFGTSPTRPRRDPRRRRTGDADDDELQRAIKASLNEEAEAKRKGRDNGDQDDDDLQKALKLSEEEDELRRRQIEQANAESLFDDTPTAAVTQPTGYNQGYQQQAAVDWFGNPMEQQPQSTGMLNNAYMQPQHTAFQPDYSAYQQPQQTGIIQQQYMPAQATGYNPWANQINGYGQQPQSQPAPVQQPQPTGANNPWASTPQQQSIAPQPTGSNNPFASSINNSSQITPQRNTLAALQEQRTAQQPTYNPITNYQAPQPAAAPTQPQQPQYTKSQDPAHAHLNALLASGTGLDTFGNTGDLRLPAQHTAPGTYVNSSGQGLNQLEVNRTGTNPFMHSQFTGMAPTQYPAQTGPARANPFGGQRQQAGQNGSLIDL